jgi:hypothetical protein
MNKKIIKINKWIFYNIKLNELMLNANSFRVYSTNTFISACVIFFELSIVFTSMIGLMKFVKAYDKWYLLSSLSQTPKETISITTIEENHTHSWGVFYPQNLVSYSSYRGTFLTLL